MRAEHYRNLYDQRKRILMKIGKRVRTTNGGKMRREQQQECDTDTKEDNASELCARNVTFVTHTRA